MPNKVIASVIRWMNGNVMVFDADGNQIPEYQGRWEDVKYKICDDMPDSVTIQGPLSWSPFGQQTIGFKGLSF